jgi:hypothetical protein
MRIKAVFTAVLLASAATAGASEVTVYPVASAQNHCPKGLQPATINGVIFCGTPTTSVTYQEVKAHPVPRGHAADCPEGQKGCR